MLVTTKQNKTPKTIVTFTNYIFLTPKTANQCIKHIIGNAGDSNHGHCDVGLLFWN